MLNKKKVTALPTHSNSSTLWVDFADYFGNKIAKIRENLQSTVLSDQTPSSGAACEPSVPLLTDLVSVSEDDLRKFIQSSNSKSCSLDPIPTSLLKSALDCLLPILCKVVNLSFLHKTMPGVLKSASVTPLLKKETLDPEDMKNYRPVSNLPYLSKLVEKVAVKQMNQHMTQNNLHEPNQSAYRQNHSTETALVKIYNDLLCAVDSKKAVMLILLDLSAAFDTVEHTILLERMEKLFGITGNALLWLKSYFSDRHQSVQLGGKSSSSRLLSYGVPQGSMMGPFTFPPYSSPLAKIAAIYGLTIHLYADNTQLYMSFDAKDGEVCKEIMETCLVEIRTWMAENFLKLNESKTEFILIGSDSVTPLLKLLHWLPVQQRIEYKLLLLTFKCLAGLAPVYLTDLMVPYVPTRAL